MDFWPSQVRCIAAMWTILSVAVGYVPTVWQESEPEPKDTEDVSGYSRFHADDSQIGMPIVCTNDDKACFHYNLVFDPTSNKCQPIGGGCNRTVNRTEFIEGSGRVIGACKEYEDPCPGYRMFYDDRCYRKNVVNDIICGSKAQPSEHFLGGVECRSSVPTPIDVRQPQEEGQCLIPDLRFPDNVRSPFYSDTLTNILNGNSSLYLQCTPMQAECFSKKSVWFSEHEGCVPLLEKGPCPEDHVVALDVYAALQRRAEAVCVHVRGGCSLGHKRMVFDGQCHEDRAIEISAPVSIRQNVLGQYAPAMGFSVSFESNSKTCVIQFFIILHGVAVTPLAKPVCAANNRNQCWLYEVENEPPLPEED